MSIARQVQLSGKERSTSRRSRELLAHARLFSLQRTLSVRIRTDVNMVSGQRIWRRVRIRSPREKERARVLPVAGVGGGTVLGSRRCFHVTHGVEPRQQLRVALQNGTLRPRQLHRRTKGRETRAIGTVATQRKAEKEKMRHTPTAASSANDRQKRRNHTVSNAATGREVDAAARILTSRIGPSITPQWAGSKVVDLPEQQRHTIQGVHLKVVRCLLAIGRFLRTQI